jgi:hypothetical protein
MVPATNKIAGSQSAALGATIEALRRSSLGSPRNKRWLTAQSFCGPAFRGLEIAWISGIAAAIHSLPHIDAIHGN